MPRVYELLSLTAASLLNQKDKNWRWVICANTRPAMNVFDPRIEFVLVDFPPAIVKTNVDKSTPEIFKFDKGTKLMAAWLHAKTHQPKYYVSLDSDDWLHHDFVAFLNDAEFNLVWSVGDGYIVNLQDGKSKMRAGMVRYCGSGFTFSDDFLSLASGLSASEYVEPSQSEMALRTRPGFITDFLGDHHAPYHFSHAINQPCRELPFPSIAWVVNNSVNFSETKVSSVGRHLDREFLSTFGVEGLIDPHSKASLKDRLSERIGYYINSAQWRNSKNSSTWKF